ncbi:Piso0_003567 [Millerozyma farinosa CBS 7064]|uniref:Piso0_003567 protein n=1 Tax=Pichia sorbitophila (strain ATCC MYA-4447 / BCRC 22081 / CBS 7064 / NBRC 10061 / NRRL Y-12695) TaxID=559304 RepID=G8YG98_PICSO|nr:Piso0_003567 [Millerozyma farinosa CBS 7064]CCE81215.1 Piso0_003567 [Millerozyma farinosa CBS 7064]
MASWQSKPYHSVSFVAAISDLTAARLRCHWIDHKILRATRSLASGVLMASGDGADAVERS